MYPTDMSAMNPTSLPEMGSAEKAMWARVSNSNDGMGRERVPWGQELWDRVDRAVHDEMSRVGVGRQFLPLVPIADDKGTIPADRVIETWGSERTVLSVSETDTADVFEIFVEFTLTKQQVAAEETLQTAVTLGTRAANLLIQGEDLLLLQGASVVTGDALFTDRRIQSPAAARLDGLANVDPAINPALLVIDVPFARDDTYGENTFNRVAEAYSELQARGHYGPYALVLPTKAYADAFAPLENTLILTADRLLPLVEGRLYGTGTAPEGVGDPAEPKDVGVLLSLGGNTLDLAFGKAATTDFIQEDRGLFRFRVYERFALRDKDRTGRVALLFETRPTPPPA
jgi:uncharacterized linocin/CFP29 family protein